LINIDQRQILDTGSTRDKNVGPIICLPFQLKNMNQRINNQPFIQMNNTYPPIPLIGDNRGELNHIHEYNHAAATTLATATVSSSSRPRPRRRTLKERIKRNYMADEDGLASSATSATSSWSLPIITESSPSSSSAFSSAQLAAATRSHSADPPTTSTVAPSREEAVLAAASALASLGVTSPTTTTVASGGTSPRASSGGCQPTTLITARTTRPSSIIRPPPFVVAASSSPSLAVDVVQITDAAAATIQPVQRPSMLLSNTNDSSGSNSRPFASSLGSDIPLTFPQKLMEVLSDPKVSSTITWLPHGKGFVILQKRKFACEVMPLYFKHSKFTSFTRKLNRWGFSRVSRGPEMGAYYHKFFQRGNYLLCMQMHCQSNNKSFAKDTVTTSPATAASSSPVTSPKHNDAIITSTSSPPIETLPIMTSTPMSPLQLDAKSPCSLPAAAAPSDSNMDDHVIPIRNSSRSFEVSGPHCHSPAILDVNRVANTVPSSFAEARQSSLTAHSLNNPGQLDRVFSRQQDILRGDVHSTYFRMALSAKQDQGGSMMQPSSSLQEPQQQQQRQLSTRQGGSMMQSSSIQHNRCPQRRSNIDQAIAIQKLLGVNTASSRSHPLIIANALKALESCNDKVLLTAFMSKDHTKTKSGTTMSASSPRGPSSYQIQRRVYAPMQAQLRQMEECGDKRCVNTNTTSTLMTAKAGRRGAVGQGDTRGDTHEVTHVGTSAGRGVESGTQSSVLSSTGVHDTVHAAMIARMKQLDSELKAQQAIIERGRGDGTTDRKMSNGHLMSQRDVAELHNGMHSQQHQSNETRSGGADEQRLKRKYPRSVRRASAA